MKNNKNNFKKDFIWNTAGNLFVSFLSLFFMVIVTRINNIEYAGIFNYGFTIAFIFYAIAQYGGRTIHVSDNNKTLSENDFFTSRIITTIISFLLFVVYIFIAGYSLKKSTIMLLLCVYKLIEALSDVIHGNLQKNKLLYWAGGSLFVRSLCALILFTISEFLFKSIYLSCALIILNNVVFFIIDYFKLKKVNKNINLKPNKDKIQLYLKTSFNTFLFTFILLFSFSIPRYFIDGLLNDELQAIYGIIIMPASLISLMANMIIQPNVLEITKLYEKKDKNGINKILFKNIMVSIALFIVLLIGTKLIGIPLLNFIYSLKLDNQLFNIILIILGSFFYLITIYLSTILIVMRKTFGQLIIYIVSSAIGLIASYYLVKNIGLNGGVYSYMLIMFIEFILFTIYYIMTLKKEFKR